MIPSRFRAAAFAALITLGGCRGGGASASLSEREAANNVSQVRVGYQKSSVLVLVKWRGLLQQALLSKGVTLEWAEFPTGPAVIEAINANQLDFGFVGEAPPIFGQVTSHAFVYIAAEPPAPRREAIVVKSSFPIRSALSVHRATWERDRSTIESWSANSGLPTRSSNLVCYPSSFG